MLQITAAGRIGKDAETRTTGSGDKVTGFSVGTDVGYGNNKKTIWLECAIWGDRGEKLARYLTKGQSVTVIGEGGIRTWESNGKSGVSMTCNVREVVLQGGKREDQQGGGQQASGNGGNGGWQPPPDLDDDIPF